MEAGINEDFSQTMKTMFALKEADANMYSPLNLAYIGDGVYDLIIRSKVLNEGNVQVNKIHKKVSSLVKAETQSAMIKVIEELLDEKELAIYKRGRNAKSFTSAKNASINDYRRATGFEALVGYLFLEGQYERMLTLIKSGLEGIGKLS